MSWHNNQFFHEVEVATKINFGRSLFNNTAKDSFTTEEKTFLPGTPVKVSMIHLGKQINVSGVIKFFRGNEDVADITVSVLVGDKIYTDFSFKDPKALILDTEQESIFETDVPIVKE